MLNLFGSLSTVHKKVFKFQGSRESERSSAELNKANPTMDSMDTDGQCWFFWDALKRFVFFPQNIKSRDLQPEAELVKPHSSPLLCETESNAANIQTTALLQFLSLHSLQTQTEASSSHSLIHDSPLSSTGSFIREALSTLWLKSISIEIPI